MSEIVVAEACRPLVLRMSLISYVLYGDSGRYADASVGYSPPVAADGMSGRLSASVTVCLCARLPVL